MSRPPLTSPTNQRAAAPVAVADIEEPPARPPLTSPGTPTSRRAADIDNEPPAADIVETDCDVPTSRRAAVIVRNANEPTATSRRALSSWRQPATCQRAARRCHRQERQRANGNDRRALSSWRQPATNQRAAAPCHRGDSQRRTNEPPRPDIVETAGDVPTSRRAAVIVRNDNEPPAAVIARNANDRPPCHRQERQRAARPVIVETAGDEPTSRK